MTKSTTIKRLRTVDALSSHARSGRAWHRLEVGVSLVVLIAVWEVLARTLFAGSFVLPAPNQIIHLIWRDRSTFRGAVSTTMQEATLGFAIGNGSALLLAFLFIRFPILDRLGMMLVLGGYCVPAVALAPILQILLPGEEPNIALAALSTFFTTMLMAREGLRSADPLSLDLIRAFGGSRGGQVRKVRLPTSLPLIVRALQLAAPAAVLGAIIGEFLGGTTGIGISMIQAQADLNPVRLWALIVIAGVVAGALYALVGFTGKRLLRRWIFSVGAAPASATWAVSAERSRQSAPVVRGALRAAQAFVSIVIVLAVWSGLLKLFGVTPYVGKDPHAVWQYLFTMPGASTNRQQILDALRITLRDAGFGLAVGGGFGCALALIVVLLPRVQKYVVAWGVSLRVLPLVAIAPLIGAIFGRGLEAAVVVCALITFFPTFVIVGSGLQSASATSLDLISAYGGSKATALRKVRIPAAVPSLFASFKIAAPASVAGALVTEWTVTGNGLGATIILGSATSAFAEIWAAVVVVAIVSLVLYVLAAFLESRAAKLGY